MAKVWEFPKYDNLDDAVRRFFEIMDEKEYSDNAQRYFSPVRFEVGEDGKVIISSIRVYKTAELTSLLKQMKELIR